MGNIGIGDSMINKLKKIKTNVRLAILASILTFVILMIISSMYINNYALRMKEDSENEVTVSYYNLIHELSGFKNQTVSLLYGLASYI